MRKLAICATLLFLAGCSPDIPYNEYLSMRKVCEDHGMTPMDKTITKGNVAEVYQVICVDKNRNVWYQHQFEKSKKEH